ncbi:MAG: CinA family protein [Alphaproteobacteria bacterium]|nr:CinA family protein [Alphaproteobacteria bacterium]
MIEEFTGVAARIGAALARRGETIAVADGATGGLISAALLTVPGATAFHRGGGVVYSLQARDVLLGLEPAELKGMRSVTESYALLQARAIRDRFGADWGVAETGSAGPGQHPRGPAAGTSCIAVAGPGRSAARAIATGSDGRVANMLAFTQAALELLEQELG